MELMLEAIIIIFMIFLCSLCLFAVLVIARDIITEGSRRRRKEEEAKRVEAPAPAPAPVIVEVPVVTAPAPEAAPIVEEPAPVVEEPAEEPAPVEAAEEEIDENAVVFSKSHVMTLAEKYAALSSEFKGYFDDIAKHAAAKEGVREFKNNNYCDYKIGAQRLIRMMIKRGEIVCQFMFIDRDFKTYASQNNVKMKPSATTVKVNEPAAVGVAKDGIDLVCQQIAEEKEYKKQLAREKRKAKRQQAAEQGEA